MLRKACVIAWVLCLFGFAYADLPLSQMSRLSTVTLERGKTEFVITARLFPNRGFDETNVWTVNGNSIVLVKFPKTYVDPQVRDFELANDWIESVSAHQFDAETVNLRIAIKQGFSVDKSRIKSEVVGDSVILYMPLPVRSGSAPKNVSEAITAASFDSAQLDKASEKVESAAKTNPETNNSEVVTSDVADESRAESETPVENVEQTQDSAVNAEVEPELPLTGSAETNDSSAVSLLSQNNEFVKQDSYKSFSIAKFVAVSLGLSGLLLVAFGVFKKLRKSTFGSGQPRVINRCSLGFKKYLAVVEFEGIRYLVAVGPHDTTLLARLDDKGEPQKFETVLVNQTRANAELSALEQIKSKVAMLSPLDKQ